MKKYKKNKSDKNLSDLANKIYTKFNFIEYQTRHGKELSLDISLGQKSLKLTFFYEYEIFGEYHIITYSIEFAEVDNKKLKVTSKGGSDLIAETFRRFYESQVLSFDALLKLLHN